MIQTDFRDRMSYGKIGEDIVRDYLERRGWIVYTPATEGAHWVDMFVEKGKRKAAMVEVKTKVSRARWNDTGFSVPIYNSYLKAQEEIGIPLWIFFVDPKANKIYGNTLDNLSRHITRRADETIWGDKAIVWFDVKSMKVIQDGLPQELLETLRNKSQSASISRLC